MPKGPFNITRPLVNCKIQLNILTTREVPGPGAVAGEVQARVNEITVDDTMGPMGGLRVDVKADKSTNPRAGGGADRFFVFMDRQQTFESVVEEIIDIFESVLEDSFVEEEPPKVRTWSIKGV